MLPIAQSMTVPMIPACAGNRDALILGVMGKLPIDSAQQLERKARVALKIDGCVPY